MRLLVVALVLSAFAHSQGGMSPGPGSAHRLLVHYRTITIDHTKVGATDSSNFTILLSGTYNGTGGILDLRTAANGGQIQNTATQPLYSLTVPADVIFTTDAGCTTPLKWEYETYSATTGAANIWIGPIATVSHTVDTVIYVCYNNSSMTTWQGGTRGQAWDTGFVVVQHLADGSTLNLQDATSNNVPFTNSSATATTLTTDGAANFAQASTQYIIGPTTGVTNFTGKIITLSAWIRPTGTGERKIIGRWGPTNFTYLLTDSSGVGHFLVNGATTACACSTTTLSNSTTYYLAGVQDVTSIRFYLNGALDKTGTDTPTAMLTATSELEIGKGGDGSPFDGKIDEVRISNVARSVDWLLSEYNNQNAPSSFTTVGAQQ